MMLTANSQQPTARSQQPKNKKMTIKERITALRSAMKKAGLAAWIVPGTDPHMNENLPNHWAERAYISGFTGSYGKVVITHDMAGLWTDGRYFIQATEQLKEGGLQMFKERVPDAVSVSEYLADVLNKGDKVGINGLIVPENWLTSYQNDFAEKGLELVTDIDVLGQIWDDRPALSDAPLFTLPENITGESTALKLERLRLSMKGVDATLFTMLDEIAWLYNVRGADVLCNPVVMSYAWVEKGVALLFVDENKVSKEDRAILEDNGVSIYPYGAILEMLPELSEGKTVQTEFGTTNHALFNAMDKAEVIDVPSWAADQKSQKNAVELEGMEKAMVKDGVALTKFYMWLDQELSQKSLSEYEVGLKLADFRSDLEEYKGESFNPIVGYKANASLPHYSASKTKSDMIKAEGTLLIDTGGQYMHGTTDITRTVALGAFSDDVKHDFTLVLKCHIALATVKFPKGTRGCQLDVLARLPLWNENKDYLHGTGHGVGHFLNVHEGPQSIRKEENPVTLKPGMVMSNEPGFYWEEHYGVRTENVQAIVEDENDFLAFKTITLFPIDKKLIDVTLLSASERDWLNDYHQDVYNQLSPFLNEEENAWLKEKTLPILV